MPLWAGFLISDVLPRCESLHLEQRDSGAVEETQEKEDDEGGGGGP